jgi:N-methylhydantoinase A/oxoprolinase/acetone carboxylase beta subunit
LGCCKTKASGEAPVVKTMARPATQKAITNNRVAAAAGEAIWSSNDQVETLGAGGGSIGWIDSHGILQVGPQSAGSEPGPACYGHGGTEATTSDANLVLDYLNPDGLLGGKLPAGCCQGEGRR